MTQTDENELHNRKCVSCTSKSVPFDKKAAVSWLNKLSQGWKLNDEFTSISKEFRFVDFLRALKFGYKVGELAELEGHHPSLVIAWGRCKVSLSTHKIKGLSENDFIMAAKADQLLADLSDPATPDVLPRSASA